ncbi:hypothetical protein SAMN06309944_0235 [Micrococcales bacterium KH10]|nr:hypothetical protein SAMN06309944_0235 [Micrococcales bacterium KH10]
MKRLDEIKARAEAATEGPWAVSEDSESSRAWFTRPFPEFKGKDGRPVHLSITHAETEFIAHAREDIPWLLAEVDRLQAQVDAVRAALANHPKACDLYDKDEAVTCGWKRAVMDVEQALGEDYE